MNREKLSVTIIAGNEEKNIRDCLESIKWADEIIVVDSESTDRTVEIAREYNATVFIKKWEGFSPQRKFALEKASHEWVLSLDADERVTPELKIEIEKILSGKDQANGYFVPRRNYFLGKHITKCFWYPDYQLRFFKKSQTSVTDKKVHEGYIVNGTPGHMKNDLIHHTHQNLYDTFKKVNDYSSLVAEEKAGQRRVSSGDLLLHPLAAFFNHYISRKGYQEGIHGFMISAIHAVTNLLTYTKIWEIQNAKKQDGPN